MTAIAPITKNTSKFLTLRQLLLKDNLKKVFSFPQEDHI